MDSSRRIVLCDPSLITRGGHHYNYVKSLYLAATKIGLEIKVFCASNADPQIVSELDAIPVFNTSVYAVFGVSSGGDVDLYSDLTLSQGVVVGNLHSLIDLINIKQYLRSRDIVFFHTVNEKQILAISQWLTTFTPRERPSVNVMLRFWNDCPPCMSAYRLAASLFSVPSMRVCLSTDTVDLAVLYTQIFKRTVHVFPIPHSPLLEARSGRIFCRDRIPKNTLVVSYLGDCRENKGFLFVSRLISDIVNKDGLPSVHFLIQTGPGPFPQVIHDEITRIHQFGQRFVTFVAETLSSGDYYAMLDESDIILVAYKPEDYRFQSSGVFTEAAICGKVVVVSGGTAIEREASRWNVGRAVIGSYDANGVFAAVETALLNFSDLSRASASAAERVHSFHTPLALLGSLISSCPPIDN
jgi:hypothetical protein